MQLVVDVPERVLPGDEDARPAEKVGFDFPVEPDPTISDSGLAPPMRKLLHLWDVTIRTFSVQGLQMWGGDFIYVAGPGPYPGEKKWASVVFSREHVSFMPYSEGSGWRWNAHRGEQSRLAGILLELERALTAKTTATATANITE